MQDDVLLEPRYVIWHCDHCRNRIEFDAVQLAGRTSCRVPCPHCGLETSLQEPPPPPPLVPDEGWTLPVEDESATAPELEKSVLKPVSGVEPPARERSEINETASEISATAPPPLAIESIEPQAVEPPPPSANEGVQLAEAPKPPAALESDVVPAPPESPAPTTSESAPEPVPTESPIVMEQAAPASETPASSSIPHPSSLIEPAPAPHSGDTTVELQRAETSRLPKAIKVKLPPDPPPPRHAPGAVDVRWLTDLGVVYFRQHQFDEAFLCFSRAAEQGFATAQFCLAVCYFNGHGTLQDESAALPWLRQAAAQGDPNAEFTLGLAYRLGRGVKPDASLGAEWMQKAAAHGHAEAIARVGGTKPAPNIPATTAPASPLAVAEPIREKNPTKSRHDLQRLILGLFRKK